MASGSVAADPSAGPRVRNINVMIIHPHRADSSTGSGTAPSSRQSYSKVSSPRSSEWSRCLLTPGQNLRLKSDSQSSRLLLPGTTGLILELTLRSGFTDTGVWAGSVWSHLWTDAAGCVLQQLVSDCLSGVQELSAFSLYDSAVNSEQMDHELCEAEGSCTFSWE